MATSKLDILIQAQDHASRTLEAIGRKTSGLQRSVQDLGTANQQTGVKVQGMTAAFFKAGLALGALNVAANLAGRAIQSAFDIGGSVLDAASAYEQSAIAFRVMIGDADRAKRLLKDISAFAAKTPFELTDVVEGSKRLLAFNFSAERIIPTFRMLGDVASGVGRDKLPFLITALGQVQAKTKLSGEELRQFTETGVPLVEELARVTGYSTAQIVGDTANLNISYDQVEQAFRNMTSEGGKFYRLMEEQSRTYDGTITNLRDNFLSMGREIIGISEDGTIREGSIFHSLTQAAQSLLQWVNDNRTAIENYGKALMDNVVAIFREHVLPRLQQFGDWLTNPKYAEERQQWINKMGEFAHNLGVVAEAGGRVIGWIAGAIGWFNVLYGKVKPVTDLLQKIADFQPLNLINKGIFEGLKLITGRASGGPVTAGRPYIVGEHEPEPFVPKQSGTILNGDQMRQAIGNSGITITIGTVINQNPFDWQGKLQDLGWQLSMR